MIEEEGKIETEGGRVVLGENVRGEEVELGVEPAKYFVS